jgi:hypothetical protein
MTKAKHPVVVLDEWVLKCPLHIRAPKHYQMDGTCKCDDKSHAVSMRRWGFRRKDGKWH